MGEDQRQRARALVDLAALDADPAVLDHVDAAPAVRPDRARRARSIELVRAASPRRRARPARPARSRRRAPTARAARGRVVVVSVYVSSGGADPRVLDHAALDGAAPEVLVDRVRAVLAYLDRDVVLGGVVDRVLAGEAPHAHRREHVEVGRERARPTPRSAPGRCPCPCSRARRRRRRARAAARTRCSRDDRARQRRDERVLALVERVGADGRARGTRRRTRRAASTTTRLDRAGGERPVADRRPSRRRSAGRRRPRARRPRAPHSSVIHRTATDVSSPPEYASTTRFGMSRFLRRSETGEAGELGGDVRAARLLRAHHDDRVVAGHRAEHVGEAGPVERDATTCAEPGGVRSTTRFALCATSTTNSPITRRRWSSGAAALLGVLGDRVRHRAAGDAHLHRAELLEVAAHRRLGGDDAVGREQLDELRLARDRLLLEQRGRCGAGVAACRASPSTPAHRFRRSVGRAARGPRACGSPPAATPPTRAVDHRRPRPLRRGARAGSAGTTPAAPAAAMSASSTVVALERGPRGPRPRPPGPSTSTRRCRRRRRPAPPRAGRRSSSIGAAEVARALDDVVVELVARRRRDVSSTPESAAANASDAATLLPSPT